MTAELVVLLVVVVTALAFDFTNGFHDTGNAMATSIATGALKPKVAVMLSAVLNLVGAFLSVEVAATVAKGVVDLGGSTGGEELLTIVFAGLVGGILWNLATWLFGLPSSSSHALFGGLIGSALAAIGIHGVVWDGVIGKVIIPALLAPVVAALVATVGTWTVHRLTHDIPEDHRSRGFRIGQVGTASLVSLAHGTNDAQKTMGVIFLALVAHGTITADAEMPFWVKFACAVAIALVPTSAVGESFAPSARDSSRSRRRRAWPRSRRRPPSSSRPATSVCRCRPRMWQPARSSAPDSAPNRPRSAGGVSPAAWRWPG